MLAPVRVHRGQRRWYRARAEGAGDFTRRHLHQRPQRFQRRCHHVHLRKVEGQSRDEQRSVLLRLQLWDGARKGGGVPPARGQLLGGRTLRLLLGARELRGVEARLIPTTWRRSRRRGHCRRLQQQQGEDGSIAATMLAARHVTQCCFYRR